MNNKTAAIEFIKNRKLLVPVDYMLPLSTTFPGNISLCDLLCEYAAQFQKVEQPGMRWVKASERLPNVGGVLFVRSLILHSGKMWKGTMWYSDKTKRFKNSDEYFRVEDIEWLEETKSSDTKEDVERDNQLRAQGWDQCLQTVLSDHSILNDPHLNYLNKQQFLSSFLPKKQ